MPLAGAPEERYYRTVLREMEESAESCADKGEVDSIYFGGGTPSLIPAAHIANLIASCRGLLQVSDDCEISLEANPGTITSEKVRTFRQSGVSRVSIGSQSFTDRELSAIGRLHTSDMISKSVSQLRAGGFSNLNLDLMLGLPGQTRETWRRSLDAVERLAVPHISVYMLDLDEQCPLNALVASGAVRVPDDDLISDLYLETIDFFSRRGYSQYEISNFALPGFACRHNLKYWQRDPVHGLGLGSHSFDGHSRYSNCMSLDDYFQSVESGQSPVNWREPVSAGQSLSESLFLGLRLIQGVDWKRLQDNYGGDCLSQYEPGMREFSKRGLVEWKDSTVRLTPSGMLISNEIFQLFI